MNRVEFMSQLERLLCDIPEHDREDAITYYNDYFDEAGAENEAAIIQELGSPGRVAATIKTDLCNGGNEEGEYTERGYRNHSDNIEPPAATDKVETYNKTKRSISWPLIIVLLVFASPLLLGVGGGILGGIVGILGGFAGIIIALICSCIAFLISGGICLVVGIIRVFMSPLEGLVLIAIGSILLAVGLLLLILFGWCALKWLPALFRMIVDWCQKLLHKKERGNQV